MAITKVTPSVSNFDSGLTVDNITIDGTEIDLSSGDLTIDVAGDIILDAGGGDIILKDDGTHWASLYTNGTNTYLQNMISDGDMYFSVSDGGSNVNALIIDGSAAGAATFNAAATATRFNAATASTTDPVLQLTDTGVADYEFTFPDTGTIQLGTSTSSNKELKLLNAGSGMFGLNVEGHILPAVNNNYSLGSSSLRYYQVWAGTNMISPTYIATGNVAAGGYQLTDTSGNGKPAVTSDANNWTILRPLASGANVAINNFANSHNRVVFRDAGELCVGTNSATGSISNTNPVVAGMFKTNSGTVSSTTSGAANTAVTFGNNSGTHIVTATLSGSGSASNDNAVAIIIVNGAAATQTDLKTGSRCVISMSSLSMQVTQTLFTGANVNWTVMRIGN